MNIYLCVTSMIKIPSMYLHTTKVCSFIPGFINIKISTNLKISLDEWVDFRLDHFLTQLVKNESM